eukprot:239101_1
MSLHIDSSGLRRRVQWAPKHAENDAGALYLQVEPDRTPKMHCIIYVALWITSLLAAIYYMQHEVCHFNRQNISPVDCKQPDYIYTPVLMDHLAKNMKMNRRVKRLTSLALMAGNFDTTATWKQYLYSIDIDIAAIVYSNHDNTRIGEVATPLTALFYENAVDEMTIIDDTQSDQSAPLWEAQILFDEKLPSEQLKVTELEKDMVARYARWDLAHARKANKKHILRTGKIGMWQAFEMGSRLSYHNKQLILLLDTKHQMPFNDQWISNALALFEQYPNLQVLGGFSGVIKQGKTFGDVNVVDMRTANMDKEAKVFVKYNKYHEQMYNKRRYHESRVNIVELIDQYKAEYFDKYWQTFWKRAKEKYYTDGFDDEEEGANDEEEDDEEAVGLFSMSFLNDFDSAVFLNEDDPNYNPHKVQTGLEGIQYIIKKRFLEKYEKEVEKRLPIPAKTLKKIRDDRQFCKNLDMENATKAEKDDCELLMQPGGQTMFDYHCIPYEQSIRAWNGEKNAIETRWIPFMFITSVRMGPIFVRRDWWFDQLLPHLSQLEGIKEDWFDIELSLYTWAAGGYVGLYDAQGFKFDRDHFVAGLKRNERSDEEWDLFENTKANAKMFKDWDVWNVTHLVKLNEKQSLQLRLRTSTDDSSANPTHPTAIENSRQIMLTMREIEKLYHPQKKATKVAKNNLMRLHNDPGVEENPLN